MADMGFMPQVEWLLRHMTGPRQTLLFSATLDSAVDQLVKRYLTDPVFHEVASAHQVTVDEMEHHFFKVHQLDKAKVAAAIARGAEKALVFVRTKRGADRLATTLEGERRPGRRDPRRPAPGRAREGASTTSPPASSRRSSRPTSRRAASTSRASTSSSTTTRRRTTRPTSTARDGRRGPARAGVVVTLVLWDQELAVERLQRRLGLSVPIIEVFSNDPRLAELAAWNPAEAAAQGASS